MNQHTSPPIEFTDTELWTLRETLRERYGQEVELQFGEAEMRLNRQDRQLATCPIAAWQDDDCTLLVAKAGPGDFRSEFFYRVQFAQNLAITPSLQLLKDPALNPVHDTVWVWGIRFRLTL